jgi:1-acyl-sn-glycerol-3-phosphate acyltransferase
LIATFFLFGVFIVVSLLRAYDNSLAVFIQNCYLKFNVIEVGADLSMLVGKLYKNGIPVRGLAHPVVFQGRTAPGSTKKLGKNRQLGRVPGLENPPADGNNNNLQNVQKFEEFGAVMVTPRNFYRLMQTGQNALLFPGGVREVFHGKDESYQLFWPEKVDFVRTAARFNATIVPVSAVGMADSFNTLLDSKELLDVPFLGERAKNFAKNVTAARFDTNDEDELFLPPIAVPGPPSRNYFVFGKPVYTHTIDPKDKDHCKEIYMNVQEEMNIAFQDILEAREKDSFKDAAPRLAFERLTGRQAPTFKIDDMN